MFQRNISSPLSTSDMNFWDTNDEDMETSPSPNVMDETSPQLEQTAADISPRTQRLLGGPPSNIYPPPEKIGNLQVPAFTTKIDYSEVPLRRTQGGE